MCSYGWHNPIIVNIQIQSQQRHENYVVWISRWTTNIVHSRARIVRTCYDLIWITPFALSITRSPCHSFPISQNGYNFKCSFVGALHGRWLARLSLRTVCCVIKTNHIRPLSFSTIIRCYCNMNEYEKWIKLANKQNRMNEKKRRVFVI